MKNKQSSASSCCRISVLLTIYKVCFRAKYFSTIWKKLIQPRFVLSDCLTYCATQYEFRMQRRTSDIILTLHKNLTENTTTVGVRQPHFLTSSKPLTSYSMKDSQSLWAFPDASSPQYKAFFLTEYSRLSSLTRTRCCFFESRSSTRIYFVTPVYLVYW